jgi:hypothetical protein
MTNSQNIEDQRRKMIVLADKYGFSSEITIECSQKLDKLLNLLKEEQNKLKDLPV